MSRGSARRVDADPGWVTRRFREIDARLDSLDTGKLSSVPGSTITIEQALTNPAGSIGFHNTDTFEVAGPGDATFTLTYVPIDGSLHVRWGALMVPVENWTLDGRTLTILDPDDLMLVDDQISTAYAYDTTSVVVETPPEPDPGAIVAFEASGWKWLQVGRTDATDYSASAFDDSAWASAAGAFGATTPDDTPPPPWPVWTTDWDQNTRMWARRTVAATAGTDLILKLRVNRFVVVYLNGAAVITATQASTEVEYTIPGASVLTSNVLAIRITDDTYTGSGTGCYFDAEVSQ